MATAVQEFGPSDEKSTFTGSAEEDMVYARTFWQSVQLLPPMESRLVSSNVKQRLKKAPPGNQPVNTTHDAPEEPPVLTSFLAKAKALEKVEQMQKLEEFSILRDQDMALHEKHRGIRVEKEKISRNKCVQPGTQAGDFKAAEDSDEGFDAADTFKDIDEFEKKRNLQTTNDVDSD